MKPIHRRTTGLLAVLLAGILTVSVYAAVSQVIAAGTMAHSDLFGGPANVTMRTLTVAPGEVLGWHYHPGVGAYTIVKSGTLNVEDGCGGEAVYTQGQAASRSTRRHRARRHLGSRVG